MTRHRFRRLAFVMGWLTLAGTNLAAHDGPPFPIVSNHVSGPYEVSIWSDPDTTDDGTPGGQFWVTMTATAGGGEVPAGTTVTVAMNPAGQAERVQRGQAVPVGGRAHNQFISFVMDHEGPFEVSVEIAGPLGTGDARGSVEATYDARPAPGMILVFIMPFALIGGLWLMAMRRRRRRAS